MEMFAGMSWSGFLSKMGRDKTYSGEITLEAVDNIFQFEILVVSTLGQEVLVRIWAKNSVPLAQNNNWTFFKGPGFHYIVFGKTNKVHS